MLGEIIFGEVVPPHCEGILSATESHMVSQKRHHSLIRWSALERPRIICCNLVRDMGNGGAMDIFGKSSENRDGLFGLTALTGMMKKCVDPMELRDLV
jgi:hypothetical protein